MMGSDASVLMESVRDAVGAGRYNPTKWEQDFLNTIVVRLEYGGGISEKQSAVLQKIYRKSQGGA